MRNVFAAALLLLFSSAAFAAADNPDAPNAPWVQVISPHFTVITNSNEKQGRRIATQFERMRAVFHVLMPSVTDDAGAPIVVLALKDKKSFRSIEPAAYLGKDQLNLAGLFLRVPNRNYVLLRLDSEGDHPFSTIYHEYTHYMLRKSDAWIPVWLNEGLAQFYQNTTLQEKEVTLGEPDANNILYLRQQSLIPLATLFAVDHNSPYYHDEQKGSVFYAESWALTHFLEINDYKNKTNLISQYSRRLIAHEDPVAAAEATFGDLKKLQQSLAFYIQGSSYSSFRLLNPINFAEDSFKAEPLPATEANAARAGVLLNVGRVDEAQTLLQTVLTADPNNALAHETMGDLKLRQHDLDAARKWYGEAVALDQASYLAHYNFAVITLQSGDRANDAAVEKSLKAALKLNPSFAPADDALANFYGSRHTNLAEAHHLNLTAVQLEPENLAYRLNAANTLAESQQYADALRVLKLARPLAKSLSETDAVTTRIEQIERLQATEKQIAQQQSQQSGPETAAGVSVTETTQPTQLSTSGGTTTVSRRNGKLIVTATEGSSGPPLPAGAPTGPRHTASGVLRGITCTYPAVLTLTLDRPGKPIALYSNNYFKISFTTTYETSADILPCTGIEDMKAKVEYGEVNDPRVAGQILSIELSK